MINNVRMGLKPLEYLYSLNPFTKVNSLPRFFGGNLCINSNFIDCLLPSALADGVYKLLLNLALATSWFVSVKR